MKKNKILVFLAVGWTVGLAGCTPMPVPSVGPFGYVFTLGTLTDARVASETTVMESEPFRVERFMDGWNTTVARTPFASEPAKLDVTLKRYEATQSGSSFEISMDVRLKGRDQYGRTLADTDLTCSAVDTRGFELGDFAQQVAGQGNLTPLTTAARDATMWQKVMTACVRDLAIPFGTALNAGPRL